MCSLDSAIKKVHTLASNADGSRVELQLRGARYTFLVERLIDGRPRRISTDLSPEQGRSVLAFVESDRSRLSQPQSMIEVERKWRPTELAHLRELEFFEREAGKVSSIQQGYLSVGEVEARVRRKNDAYVLTLKSGGTLSRYEVEFALTEKQWSDLWPGTEGQRLEKVRREVMLSCEDGTRARIEIDRFQGRLSSLVLIECEFASLERAADFKAPPFFGVEVTEDPLLKNKALAVREALQSSLSSGVLPLVS